ncbi:MAG: hypothetical protein ABJQ29_05180 [Luteolibacter sp.]
MPLVNLTSSLCPPFHRRFRIVCQFIAFLLFVGGGMVAATPEIITSLIDPVKLDSLTGDRAANGRMRKIAYWLESNRKEGHDPATVISIAQRNLGYEGTERAKADKASLLRNLVILERLGCLTESGMDALRRGKAPTITQGPYAGDIVHVDHIIPRAIAPGLDEKIYNLEFMPGGLNMGKGARIGQRQIALAKQWLAVDLISAEEYRSVMIEFGG